MRARMKKIVGELENLCRPLNMRPGHGDLLGTDFDLSDADTSEHTTRRDSATEQNRYRDVIGDVDELDSDIDRAYMEVKDTAEKLGAVSKRRGGAEGMEQMCAKWGLR